MGKLLTIVLGLVLACWILRRFGKAISRDDESAAPTGGEDMVRCSHCGVHLPRSESITEGGKFFCSAEHKNRQSG